MSEEFERHGVDYKARLKESNPRADLLREAEQLVNGDRNNQYGPPTQDFDRSAALLTALGYRKNDGQLIEGHDIAIIITAVKLSRLMWSPEKRDSWTDVAGYAACGWECVHTREMSTVKKAE